MFEEKDLKMSFQAITGSDQENAISLAHDHPYKDAAYYRIFGYDLGTSHLVHNLSSFLENLENQPAKDKKNNIALLATKKEQAIGFIALKYLSWESDHFGIKMGTVPFLFATGQPQERAEISSQLLVEIEKLAKNSGFEHLSIKLDVNDTGVFHAATCRKWRPVDTIVTWVHDSQGMMAEEPDAPDFERVTLEKKDLPDIPRSEIVDLENFIHYAYRIGRFHSDLRLPQDLSDALYVNWFNRVFDGSWADGVQAIRRDGRYVGFCSFQHLKEIEELGGPRVIGRGLAAVLPEAKGGYAVLTRMIHRRCPLGSRFQEFDTQINNYPPINIWARESMRFVKTRATLHCWLDEHK